MTFGRQRKLMLCCAWYSVATPRCFALPRLPSLHQHAHAPCLRSHTLQVEDVGSIGNVVQDKTSAVEHIGEAMPVLPDGSCEHPYLVPNANGTLCILPSRLDIGRHYMITGGRKSLKEPYGSLVSRILGFSKYVPTHVIRQPQESELSHAVRPFLFEQLFLLHG